MATNFVAPNENAIEFLSNEDTMTVTISDQKLANQIKKLAKRCPDQVEIIASGQKNGGYLYARMPRTFLNIRKPSEYPERNQEQSEVLRERIEKAREARARGRETL